jgi:hypothetical protein
VLIRFQFHRDRGDKIFDGVTDAADGRWLADDDIAGTWDYLVGLDVLRIEPISVQFIFRGRDDGRLCFVRCADREGVTLPPPAFGGRWSEGDLFVDTAEAARLR